MLMKIRLQVIIETEPSDKPASHQPSPVTQHLFELHRAETELTAQTLGLNMAEAKEILAGLQQSLVSQQITQYLTCKQTCPDCGTPLALKGRHHLVFRS